MSSVGRHLQTLEIYVKTNTFPTIMSKPLVHIMEIYYIDNSNKIHGSELNKRWERFIYRKQKVFMEKLKVRPTKGERQTLF